MKNIMESIMTHAGYKMNKNEDLDTADIKKVKESYDKLNNLFNELIKESKKFKELDKDHSEFMVSIIQDAQVEALEDLYSKLSDEGEI